MPVPHECQFESAEKSDGSRGDRNIARIVEHVLVLPILALHMIQREAANYREHSGFSEFI